MNTQTCLHRLGLLQISTEYGALCRWKTDLLHLRLNALTNRASMSDWWLDVNLDVLAQA